MQLKLRQREQFRRSRLFRYRSALAPTPYKEPSGRNGAAVPRYSGFGFFSPGHLPVVR
jgi:hypothetical protein